MGVIKYGTDGTDWFFGTDDNDDLYGYGGNDLLVGLGGVDVLYGDAGDDLLFGGAGNDFLVGGEGKDHLDGGDGADTLLGESGDDILIGGSGSDWLDGGSGNDTVSYRDSPAGVFVSLYANYKHAWGGDAEGDMLFGNSIENLWGSKFNDVLWGGDADNVLKGFEGNDILRGFYGADTLDGGDGNDELYGDYSNDYLTGGRGNDRLEGGQGGDTMSGGSGADKFVWMYTTESNSGAWNTDSIMDFNRAEGDVMDLHGIDANDYWVPVPGNQDFTFIGDASHPFTAPGQISWYIGGSPTGEPSGTDTYILLNTDTEPDAEGVIKVSGMHGVDASWFVL